MPAVLSRRGVLGAGAVALGIGVVAPAAHASPARPAAASEQSPGIEHDPLVPVRSMFAGHEGQEYVGMAPWSQHRLVLSSIGDLQDATDPEHGFRVDFTSDADARDGIYRILQGGELVASLFLARVTEDPRLEAVVDRRSFA